MIEMQVDVDGATLAASRSPGDRLMLIALHGSQPGTRDGPLYRHLHEVLPEVGIGVVTFDRRGEGESSGTPSLGNFEQQARDCMAIMDSLEQAHLGLWGFSQGGWIAPLVAAQRPDVACIVTVGASGVTPFEQMRFGVARHLTDAGYDAAVVRRADLLWVTSMRALRGDRDSLDAVGGLLKEASDEAWWPLVFLPDELPDAERRADLLREMEHDPLPSFRAVACPVLAIYGEHDEWVPVEPSVRAWREAQPLGATTVVLAGGHHDPLDGDASVAAAYEQPLVPWLSAVGASAKR